MRRPKTVAVLAAAILAAAVGATLAVLGVPVGGAPTAEAVAGATPRATASTSPPAIDDTVTADDYCYVEAMIYYRVKEQELAQTLLRKDGVAPAAAAFAEDVAAEDGAELDDLRAWYVSWVSARPIEPPKDGPCGGHGSDHAQMPGMPTWSSEQGLVDAQTPEAEQRYAGIARDQNAGMTALVAVILDGDPHPRVRASAEAVLERAKDDGATIARILGQTP